MFLPENALYNHYEGASTVEGTYQGKPIKGYCYVELIGDWSRKQAQKEKIVFGFSHAAAFNKRHKILMAIQDSLEAHPVELSGIVEPDETFVLESRKGAQFSESSDRSPRKHGAKVQKRGMRKCGALPTLFAARPVFGRRHSMIKDRSGATRAPEWVHRQAT